MKFDNFAAVDDGYLNFIIGQPIPTRVGTSIVMSDIYAFPSQYNPKRCVYIYLKRKGGVPFNYDNQTIAVNIYKDTFRTFVCSVIDSNFGSINTIDEKIAELNLTLNGYVISRSLGDFNITSYIDITTNQVTSLSNTGWTNLMVDVNNAPLPNAEQRQMFLILQKVSGTNPFTPLVLGNFLPFRYKVINYLKNPLLAGSLTNFNNQFALLNQNLSPYGVRVVKKFGYYLT